MSEKENKAALKQALLNLINEHRFIDESWRLLANEPNVTYSELKIILNYLNSKNYN